MIVWFVFAFLPRFGAGLFVLLEAIVLYEGTGSRLGGNLFIGFSIAALSCLDALIQRRHRGRGDPGGGRPA